MSRKNKWYYRDRVRSMPRMRNLPPYDCNQICFWFAVEFQTCCLKAARKHFEAAQALSRRSFQANPIKYPRFLLFDQRTHEWHGCDVP